jgi:hypothetical protein
MPNYEIVRKFCNLCKKEATFPETYVAQAKGEDKLIRYIEDCLSKEEKCPKLGCKYASGNKDPLTA